MDKFEKHHRNSVRLKGYDYSQPGSYFITICTKNEAPLFGEISNHKIILSSAGKIANKCWLETEKHFKNIKLDQFIFMPDHFHAIIHITNPAPRRGLINQTLPPGQKTLNIPHKTTPSDEQWILMKNPKQVLGKIIRYFKGKSAKLIREKGYDYFQWQRNYHDHIIRNKKELQKIREYIIENPVKWTVDKENPPKISGKVLNFYFEKGNTKNKKGREN